MTDATKDRVKNQAILANTVNKLRRDRFAKWSRDQLLCHPTEAHEVCVTIRQGLAFAADYSDFDILWTYLNFSKRSKLVSGIPRRKYR